MNSHELSVRDFETRRSSKGGNNPRSRGYSTRNFDLSNGKLLKAPKPMYHQRRPSPKWYFI